MNHTGNGSKYLCKKLCRVEPITKLKRVFSNDPQIHMVVYERKFKKTINPFETFAWKSCVNVTQNLLGNHHV